MHDFVFCASVLLHLTDPLRALFAMRKVVQAEAIVCTGIDTAPRTAAEPRALFVGQPDGQAFWLPTVDLPGADGPCRRLSRGANACRPST